MAHENGSFGGDIVHAILQFMSRGDVFVVHAPLLGKPAAVKDIARNQYGAADQKYQDCIHSYFFSSPI